MKKIKNKIQMIIKDQDKGQIFLKFFLSLLSIIYRFAITINIFLYKKKVRKIKKLPCFVISVGNITTGGTGKTPLVLYLAELIDKLGYKPAVISRGYKSGYEKKGGIVSDGKEICANVLEAGDEPFMIAKRLKNIPVIVGKNRYKAGMLGINKFGADLIILDDGFQHQKLFRDINLLLLDHKKPFGNKKLLPRGILREPISSVRRADALILTRCEGSDSENLNELITMPFFKCQHTPFMIKNKRLILKNKNFFKNKKAFIFSAIAKNEEFYNTVRKLGCFIISALEFDDHHRYLKEDFEKIAYLSKSLKPDIIITTEKDYVKMPLDINFFCDLIVIGITISFLDKNSINFNKFIEYKLKNDAS